MPFDIEEYKEMVEKTKLLHEDLVRLSNKMETVINSIDHHSPGINSYGAPKGFVPLDKKDVKGFVELSPASRGHLK